MFDVLVILSEVRVDRREDGEHIVWVWFYTNDWIFINFSLDLPRTSDESRLHEELRNNLGGGSYTPLFTTLPIEEGDVKDLLTAGCPEELYFPDCPRISVQDDHVYYLARMDGSDDPDCEAQLDLATREVRCAPDSCLK